MMVPAQVGDGRPHTAHAILGRRLRTLREASGVTAPAASRYLGGSTSKLTRMERGQVSIKEADLQALLLLYGVTDSEERHALLQLNCRLNEPKWWAVFGQKFAEWYCSYLVLESIAHYIWTYENRFIPGLLQTPAYAEAIIRSRYSDEETIRQMVAVRRERQRMILHDKTTRLWAIIDQAALDDGPDGAGIMQEQVEFLQRTTQASNIRIQVVKAGAGAHAARSNSFSILRLRGTTLAEVVYLEHLDRAFFLDNPQDSEPYRIAMNEIGVAADAPDTTRHTLDEALHRVRQRHRPGPH